MPQDMLNKTLGKVKTALDVLAEIMELLKKETDNVGAQEIYDHYKNDEKCDTWSCDPSAVKDLDKKLTEAGIMHACVQYPENNLNGKNNILFVTKETDREAVRNIRSQCLKEIGYISKVSLDQLKRDNVGDNIHTINGVSRTYATIFQEGAKESGFAVAATDNKNGTFNIHYAEKDAEKARPVLMKTIESTRGVTGRINEDRVSVEVENRDKIYNSIADAQKEFYIVSATQPNEYMHFTAEGYQHYRNERLIGDELRSNRNYQQDAHNRIDSVFVKPVVLTREEYERVRDLPKEEREKEINKKHKTTTKITSRDAHQLELERMAHQLAEFKMSFDNNTLNNDYYNNSVSINNFINQEIATDARIDREVDRNLAENTTNREELPAEVQSLVAEYEKLSYEDRVYVDEFTKECIEDIRGIETRIEIEEITYEELRDDLDAVIDSFSGEEITYSTREDVETERDV